MATNDNSAQIATYLRSGLTFLGFACEQGPTASASVRKAIAMALDKDALVQEVAGGTARRVYGYYGLGQWMATYSAPEDTATGQAAVNMQEELAKFDVLQDLSAATSLLESDGWTLNSQGQPFQQGQDTVRYRQGANGPEALRIDWAKTQGNTTADVLERMLGEVLPQLGVELNVTEMPFTDVLAAYYNQDERPYNMFYLANNFMYVFDPYYDFNTADTYQGIVNPSGLRDDELMKRALDMRETPASDMAAYATKWLAFQARFVELMPMVPLYSNVYFDFYGNDLQGYDIALHPGWSLAIPYAYIDADGSLQGQDVVDTVG